MVIQFGLLLTAVLVLGLATELALESVGRVVSRWPIATVTRSLFILGVVTAFPELAIVMSAVALDAPQVALGNLIGGQVFLVLAAIPSLAVITKGLGVKTQLHSTSLILALLVAAAPLVALLDQNLNFSDITLIGLMYLVFAASFIRHGSTWERLQERWANIQPTHVGFESLKLIGLLAIISLASYTAVREIIDLAAVLQAPRFLLSFLLLPLATNLPELSLAWRAHRESQSSAALSDYLGSLAFNSCLVVLLTAAYQGSLDVGLNVQPLIWLSLGGMVLFWWSSQSKEYVSTRESLGLLALYGLLVAMSSWLLAG